MTIFKILDLKDQLEKDDSLGFENDSDNESMPLSCSRSLRNLKPKETVFEGSSILPKDDSSNSKLDLVSSEPLFHSSQLQLDGASVIENCQTPECSVELDEPKLFVLEPVLPETSDDKNYSEFQKMSETLKSTSQMDSEKDARKIDGENTSLNEMGSLQISSQASFVDPQQTSSPKSQELSINPENSTETEKKIEQTKKFSSPTKVKKN